MVEESGGHLCFYVKINSPNDPAGAFEDTAENNNIAERCIQVSQSSRFRINNPGVASDVQLSFRCQNFPVNDQTVITMVMPLTLEALLVWQDVPSVELEVYMNEMFVRFWRCNVDLPAFSMGADEILTARFNTYLPPTLPWNRYYFELRRYDGAGLIGGVTFYHDN